MNEHMLRQQIANELPNVPEEIREAWLLPAAKNNGWPPSGLYWHGVLLKRDLAFWKETIWSEQTIDLEKAAWSYGTNDALAQMQNGFRGNVQNSFGTTREKNRILSPLEHLLGHGSLPGKIALLAFQEGFELIDGHHRYLAFIEAKNIMLTIEKCRVEGNKSDLNAILEKIKSNWGIESIAYIPSEHKVWVAQGNNK